MVQAVSIEAKARRLLEHLKWSEVEWGERKIIKEENIIDLENYALTSK